MTQNYSCSLSMVSSKQICQRPKHYFLYPPEFAKLLLGLLLVGLALLCNLARAQTFLVGCWMQEGSVADLGMQGLYQDALAELGWQLEWRRLPVARAQFEMAQGMLDADCARHDQYQLQLADGSQVIRVPVVVGGSTVGLWQARGGNHLVEDLSQAAELGLRIVYERGTDIALRHLQLYPSHLVFDVSDSCVAMRMLDAGRVDLLLSATNEFMFRITGQPDCPEPEQVASVHRINAVPILHPRHQELALPLAQVLTRLLEQKANQ